MSNTLRKLAARKTILTMALASAPITANALDLKDYLVANSSFDDAFISGNLTGLEPAGDDPNDQFGYSFSLDADYSKTFSTLPRSWNYTLGLLANGNRPSTRTTLVDDPNFVQPDPANPVDVPQISIDTESSSDVQFEAEGVVDNYFHESQYPQAFWFGQGEYRTQESLPDDDISATIGIGYGRVYNATPLAMVIRIVQELNEEGLLTGPIPDSVALETAEIIDRIDEFRSRFGEDDYRPEYYAAIETALARSGALLDGKFGALGALKVDKVLEDEPISTRKHGWVVRLGVGFQASDVSGLTDNDPKLLFQWEYTKPFGYKGQFINTLGYEPIFTETAINRVSNDMSYTYEVSDRIDWVNTWSFDYLSGDNELGQTEEVITNIFNSRYSYDLGNSLDYFIGVRLTQTDIEPNEPNSFGDDPEIRLESGFKYRLK